MEEYQIFLKIFNENIQCDHGYTYSTGEMKMCTWVNEERCTMMKTCFSNAKQIKKFPKTTLCQECTYVQKYRIESDENFDSPPDNEPTFS